MKVILIALWPISAFARAVLITLMWGWFIQPLGMPAISTGHAYGLACFVAIFHNYEFEKEYDADPEKAVVSALASLVWQVILLGVAYSTYRWWV